MKKVSLRTLAACLACTFTIALTACDKNDDNNNLQAVSEDEAADAVTEAVVPTAGGMVAQINDAVVITSNSTAACGATFDSSISGSNAAGSVITYSYNLNWNWVYKCSNSAFEFAHNGNFKYDAPRISSDDKSEGSFVVSGVDESSANYILNSNYKRNGTQQSKILNKNSFSSNITITSTDITVSKASREIVSGTASVTVSGASTGGVAFNYSGTLTFLGNKTATLELGNGNTYNISW